MRKQWHLITAIAAVFVLLLTAVVALPTKAQPPDDRGQAPSRPDASVQQQRDDRQPQAQERSDRSSPEQSQQSPPQQAQEGRERGEAAQQQAQERVQRIQDDVAQRRAQIEQEVCERRQAQLEVVMPRLSTNATTLLNTFDTVYDRVQGFYESEQLMVENYDELAASVDDAQVDAAGAVEAAETYQFELDCDNPNVGEQLDGFRTAMNDARAALNDYREELVALISALRDTNADNATNEEDAS